MQGHTVCNQVKKLLRNGKQQFCMSRPLSFTINFGHDYTNEVGNGWSPQKYPFAGNRNWSFRWSNTQFGGVGRLEGRWPVWRLGERRRKWDLMKSTEEFSNGSNGLFAQPLRLFLLFHFPVTWVSLPTCGYCLCHLTAVRFQADMISSKSLGRWQGCSSLGNRYGQTLPFCLSHLSDSTFFDRSNVCSCLIRCLWSDNSYSEQLMVHLFLHLVFYGREN